MSNRRFKEDIYEFNAGPLGHIEGITLSDHSNPSEPLTRYFGGLPYALPPVAPYRFRKPRPLPDQYRYGTKANPGRFIGAASICPQPHEKNGDPSIWEEDCLQLNIHIPASGERPAKGWPVFFYIHGGFLQWGDPNIPPSAIAPLLSETAFKAIIVMPAYRLNMFGFVASLELQAEAAKDGHAAGNMGFWDQRLALEWTARSIEHFGGDRTNITVGGYSAGAHSAFHQLAHELYFVPDKEAVISRVIMWSNSSGVQPRTATEQQTQFDEVLQALDISSSLSAREKLDKLRATPAKQLIDIQDKLQLSEFRATSDDQFVSKQLMVNIDSGDFGQRMKARAMKLMNGECRDEHTSYQTWRTPLNTFDAVRTRLIADYPEAVVNKLMEHYCGEHHCLPSGVKDWRDLFGRLYANMQVHSLERGFQAGLERGGLTVGEDLLRYRFDWRARCIDGDFPLEMGVTHSSDMAIWFWGLDFGNGLTENDKQAVTPWNKAFAAFVKGDDPEWRTKTIKDTRRLRSDGSTDVWSDDQWDEGLKVWDLVRHASLGDGIIGWIRGML